MIIFQITLTGPMLQYLAALKHQEEVGVEALNLLAADGRFVTTMQSIMRQNLASHELPINYTTAKNPGEYKFKGKRRFIYEITPKGMAALQLAGFDLSEFLTAISKGLSAPVVPRYQELYKDTPEGQRVRSGRGRHVRPKTVVE